MHSVLYLYQICLIISLIYQVTDLDEILHKIRKSRVEMTHFGDYKDWCLVFQISCKWPRLNSKVILIRFKMFLEFVSYLIMVSPKFFIIKKLSRIQDLYLSHIPTRGLRRSALLLAHSSHPFLTNQQIVVLIPVLGIKPGSRRS